MGNLLFGIMMVIGGISGTMALRGTGSPAALIVVGVVFCIFGVSQLSSDGKKSKSRSKTSRTSRRNREEGNGRPSRATGGQSQRGRLHRARR